MSLSGANWWPELKPWRGEWWEVSSPTFGLIPGLIYGFVYGLISGLKFKSLFTL